MLKLENVYRILWEWAWASTYYAHEQTKLHAEMMSWIASVYECCLCSTLNWSDLYPACITCTVCEQPVVDGRSIAAVTNKMVPCMLKLELSPLCLPTLHSGSSQALPFTIEATPTKCMRMFNFWEIFKCTFKIYGIRLQASMYIRYQHTSTMQSG